MNIPGSERMRSRWLAVVGALLLAACGQKGPLYLPGAQKTPVTPNPGAATPASVAPQATPLAPGTALDPQPVPVPKPPVQKQQQQSQPQQQQNPGEAPAGPASNSPPA